MSVAQPDHLLVFGESSGTSITQYGTADAGYVINEGGGAENTDYVWNPNADEELSYLESQRLDSAHTIWLTTSATTPGTTMEAMNCALKFRAEGLSSLNTSWLVYSGNPLRVELTSPTSTGDFDLDVRFLSNFYEEVITFPDLSFDTDYVLSLSSDPSNPASVQFRAKLDGGTVQTASADWSGSNYADTWPMLLADGSFWFNQDFGGFLGFIYWFAYQRGGTAWSSTDLGDINSNPATITGWPGGGGASVVPVINSFLRMMDRNN